MNKNKKVVLYTNIITPYTIFRYNNLNKILRGHLIVIYQSATERNREWVLKKDLMEYEYKVLNSRKLGISGSDMFCFSYKDRLIREISKIDFDVFISVGWNSLSTFLAQRYCRGRKRKFILWSGSTANERSIFRSLSRPFVRNLIRKSDGYIVYGTRAKEYVTRMGALPEKISVGWNCVDNKHFKDDWDKTAVKGLKKKYNIHNKKVIIYCGQFIKRKGILELMNAYMRLKEKDKAYALILIGNGREGKNLKNVVRKKNIKDVFFTGFIDYEKIPNYYRLGDVFVLPSKQEVWGLVVNEAMACGLPVVVSEKCGCSVDLVSPGLNGEILEDLTPGEMADKIDKAYEKREKYGLFSQRYIEDYSIEVMMDNILGLL